MRPPPLTLGSSLSQPVDVAESINACPVESTTNGTFFQHVRDAVSKRRGTIPAELMKDVSSDRWTPFQQYSLRDFMHLTVNAASILYPNEPTAEALRRIGWLAYPTFASTMGGRIVLYAFGEKVPQIIKAAPRIFAVTVPGMEVTVLDQGDRHARLHFQGLYTFPDCYMRGVLEGAVWCHGFDPDVTVTIGDRPSNAEFLMRW
jgi:uncharacterized protein (TIGR02265 family)